MKSEVRLDGPGRLLVSADDVLWVDVLPDGSMKSRNEQPVLIDVSIPDSIIVMKSSYGWNLIAAEPAFLVLCSVPDKNGYKERELLVLNRATGQWSSLLVPGAETAPRLVGRWLVAAISPSDPRTDFVKRGGYPPLRQAKSVMVNPMMARQFTVHLGEQSEVLWIEDSTAYYRVQDSLFTARVANDDFKDRRIILTDPRVLHIHWAFRGGEDSAKKE